ncbi:MAG: phosphate acetyltransferase [Bilophila sp.]
MANTLYITATETHSGKSAITMGLMQLLVRHVRKVAFFRPVVDRFDEKEHDRDVELILKHFGLDIPYEDTYACLYAEARELITAGKTDVLIEKIMAKYKALEANYDFILCQGSDFCGKNAAFQFDLNAEIATNLDMPIALVVNGNGKKVDEVLASVRTSLELLVSKERELGCVFINRATLTPAEITRCQEALCTEHLCHNIPIFILPEESILCKPTVKDVQQHMNAEVLFGASRLDNPVNDYIIAAMQTANFLDHVGQGLLVITPGDRADIILASLTARFSRAYPDVAGILLTGGFELPQSIVKLMEGWTGTPVPILSVKNPTYSTLQDLMQIQGRIVPGDLRKINAALALFERSVNVDMLAGRIINRCSCRMTPMMFEFKLIEQAKRHKMRIVLPEGTEERVLRAADVLCQREVVDIILLGNSEKIQAKKLDLGLDLHGATIIQPELSPLYEEYAEAYQELRKSKGVSLDEARDRMADATYFATMMVHRGNADGMVSGSINTTAHTIRPAFEIIKTKPGSSIVSSVFLMCLKDRVLVFGDCAVNPNPTATQLADIAISSAETAQIFGISPRVAMLSYSTGSSGKGADVDVVVEATRLAHERAPHLTLDGPIQYDAAIDPDVARTKAPGSQVAGKATVFIFPDLNTGNNTYKAVQRAASAVAIGPVLQGLNKPVNDLSRGCTVPDILNTVTITAIQAQAEKGLISFEE